MATWKKQSATRKVNAAARRAQRDFIGTALIEALRAEVPAHLCIYCERPLSGIQRFICRRVDSDGDKCVRLYNSDWRRGQRMRHATEAAWKLKRRKCQHPECTGRFYPKQEQDTHCVAHRGTPSAL